MINKDSDNITIKGHEGTWYVIGNAYHKGNQVYLLEHEEYGDEAPSLIVDKEGNIILEEVYNGFFDLEIL